MKKLIILLSIALSSTLALANERSMEYDSFMRECLDYGHSYKSEAEVNQCKAEAKAKGLVGADEPPSKAPVTGAPAASTKANQYDLIMMDCLDYGHSYVSEEQANQCKAQAKSEILAIGDNQMKFLDCIDYGHSIVTEEREISCLREISEIN